MKTQLNKQHSFMIIIVVAGLILAALAFLKPASAEAGVVVTARIGNVGVSVSPGSPRGVIVQTGPRSYRCIERPAYGRYVWVPGHFEKVLEIRDCRRNHKSTGFKPGKGKYKRTKRDHLVINKNLVTNKRGRKAPRHNHYRDIWVSGHWERV